MIRIKNLKYFFKIGDVIVSPIVYNCAFFLNVILLLIIPTILNAFFINRSEYVSFSHSYPFGILIKYGASFPYILFIPFVSSYVISLITCLFRNRKVRFAWKAIVYAVTFFLCSINVFLLCNFKTMLSPSIVLLIHETDMIESTDFVQNYLWDIHSLYAYVITIVIIVLLITIVFFARRLKYAIECIYSKIFLLIVVFYMFMRFESPFAQFVKLFECTNLDSIEFWYLDYRPDCNTLTNVIYSFFLMKFQKSSCYDLRSIL